jgi:hypothetical protein
MIIFTWKILKQTFSISVLLLRAKNDDLRTRPAGAAVVVARQVDNQGEIYIATSAEFKICIACETHVLYEILIYKLVQTVQDICPDKMRLYLLVCIFTPELYSLH